MHEITRHRNLLKDRIRRYIYLNKHKKNNFEYISRLYLFSNKTIIFKGDKANNKMKNQTITILSKQFLNLIGISF